MDYLPQSSAILQEIIDPRLANIKLYIKREDLIHPTISGNKWRKLKYNIRKAQQQGMNTLLTFGGAFSNHIYAVAALGKELRFKTIGIIRGERHTPLNPTLQFAEDNGMILEFVSREQYRNKQSPQFIAHLHSLFGDFYFIPEGGSNAEAVAGCAEIVSDIPIDFDIICTPCGTGGTLAGIITGLKGTRKAIGFSALKGNFLTADVQNLLTKNYHNWHIDTQYHFGGYAKFRPELIDFINDFYRQHKIILDPVYTGKMMFGIFDLVKQRYFPEGSTVIAVHTGGIQAIAGFNQRYGNLIHISS